MYILRNFVDISVKFHRNVDIVRFGSFQVALPTDKYTGQSGPSVNNVNLVRGLLDYVIRYHHRDIMEQPEEKRYDILLARVAEATAEMVAGWQTVG